jgi:hypothetical protein
MEIISEGKITYFRKEKNLFTATFATEPVCVCVCVCVCVRTCVCVRARIYVHVRWRIFLNLYRNTVLRKVYKKCDYHEHICDINLFMLRIHAFPSYAPVLTGGVYIRWISLACFYITVWRYFLLLHFLAFWVTLYASNIHWSLPTLVDLKPGSVLFSCNCQFHVLISVLCLLFSKYPPISLPGQFINKSFFVRRT